MLGNTGRDHLAFVCGFVPSTGRTRTKCNVHCLLVVLTLDINYQLPLAVLIGEVPLYDFTITCPSPTHPPPSLPSTPSPPSLSPLPSLPLPLPPQLLREITKVMRECWYYTSTARPTAVYLKKKLLKMAHELEKMNYGDLDVQQAT